ncbi:sortase A [Modestobacter sp. DSM 44400]|uniref:class E sortase n=1 Tax=Modestobacter sp. DSM 44400 TaxID=1550230 RepID=UPI00089430E7|nr:class E sortase [Modestobacter sp. DSM 44400]SDY23782.1 sortase A [Modestobacter sp. DSM 44400]
MSAETDTARWETRPELPPRGQGVRERARRRRAGDVGRTVVRGIGQALVTLGLVVLLFVVYEVWVTDLLTAQRQGELSDELQEGWDAPTVTDPGGTPAPIDVALGQPFAVLHIPRLGADWSRVVVEGTGGEQLAQGPGHYAGTAMPGEQGNVALAGHRVGRGSPFLDLDRMRPGDPIVVETADFWFVYRVLGDAATGDLGADPSGIPGMQIVRPSQVDVIAPTPDGATDGAATGAYLTVTTCHPKYSARQRLIVHAVLDGSPVSRTEAPDGPDALRGD